MIPRDDAMYQLIIKAKALSWKIARMATHPIKKKYWF